MLIYLGLLYEHHHYAYRLEQIIEKRGMRNFIKIEFSSIYYVLKRFEEKKLVEAKLRKMEGKTARKVYYITDNGKLAMEEKIKHILSVNQKQISSPCNCSVFSPIALLKAEKEWVYDFMGLLLIKEQFKLKS